MLAWTLVDSLKFVSRLLRPRLTPNITTIPTSMPNEWSWTTHEKHRRVRKRAEVFTAQCTCSRRDKMEMEPHACIAITTLAAVLLRPVAAHVHIPNAASRHGSLVQDRLLWQCPHTHA
jgi:hypothetical protein